MGGRELSKGRWIIPDNWNWVYAEEISDIISGGTPSTREIDNFTKNGIPWLTPADLSNYQFTYIERGARDISEKGLRNSSARIIPKGAVLFTSRAPIGYCVVASNEISTNQGFKSFVPYGNILPEFIRFYLLISKSYAESLASGSTFKELSAKKVATLEIPLPPLNEQKRIVGKIEALQKRSQRV
ncbi:MAG: restriction endonuclease subunit S, partial [Cyanobacteria bacterium J06649_11]